MTDTDYQLWAAAAGLVLSFIAAAHYFIAPRNTPSQTNPTWQQLFNENEQLLEFWETCKDYSTIVITIQVYILEQDESKITEIGVSVSSLEDVLSIHSFNWPVKENFGSGHDGVMEPTHIFSFGPTRPVSEDSISSLLSTIFGRWTAPYERACIVVHGMGHVLGFLNRYWKLPEDLPVFDTRRLSQFQHQGADGRLEDCLRELPSAELHDVLLGNAGNDSRYIMHLFRHLARHSRKARQTARVISKTKPRNHVYSLSQ